MVWGYGGVVKNIMSVIQIIWKSRLHLQGKLQIFQKDRIYSMEKSEYIKLQKDFDNVLQNMKYKTLSSREREAYKQAVLFCKNFTILEIIQQLGGTRIVSVARCGMNTTI